MSETDPRRLGVHAAISVPGVPDEVPPEYVPRDADAALRAKVAAAKKRGGFVLLVGGSSVGKTRTAAETVKALLPDWWLMHPAGSAEVTALAAAPPPQMVVWLDELQRYLEGEHGLTGGVVRALLGASHPVVIISTLWPDRYTAYTTLPAPGGSDPHAREREVLGLADVVRIDPEFTPAEQERARTAAALDPRLRIALDTAGYGLTQTLAAAPQLVARWVDAQSANPYAWAALTAALDAARLGARVPLSADFLHAAAPGYLTSQQQAEAPGNWFEQALAYATVKLHGAAAALTPAGAGMRQVAGYTVADYLMQQASRERRSVRVPADTWNAILSHIRDPADAARLADSAQKRLLYRYAIPLYRRAADAGIKTAASRLAELLAQRGDVGGLRARADAGDVYAARRLALLSAEPGDRDEAEQILRAQADAGIKTAAILLAELLAQRGDRDGAAQILRAPADAGDWNAGSRLADLLAQRGDRHEAEQILRAQADAGDANAAWRLALLHSQQQMALLAERDLAELRARADAGDVYAAWRLALPSAEPGDRDEAEQILRARADADDGNAAILLAELMADRGDRDEAEQILRARADAGDGNATRALADLLAKGGDLAELRDRTDAGDKDAAVRLADLLAKGGDLAELRDRADAGDWIAGSRLADLLAKGGDLAELRDRADAGDKDAAVRLADLLAQRGDRDEAAQILRAPADAGDWIAGSRLADLLAKGGDLAELRDRTDAGDGNAARALADLLAELLTKQGRGEEAERLRRFGLNPDGSTACA